jgi:predicted permease
MGQRPIAVWTSVTPGYFKTIEIPLIEGRDFTDADDENAPKRVIVSRSLARRYWPDESPIGKHITYARREYVAEIVGVAGDVKTRGLDLDANLVYYTPHRQFAWPNVSLTFRTEGDPRQVLNSARAAVFSADRDLPVNNPRTLQELVDGVLSDRRQTMFMVAGFAVVALLLAVVGLYGVMAYSVAQRTAEIGIRQAVGAQRTDIFRMVLHQGLRLSVAGIVIGVIAALAMTRLLAAMLFHLSATDPLTFAGISMLFLMVAMVASIIPAWRATRVDPLEALR